MKVYKRQVLDMCFLAGLRKAIDEKLALEEKGEYVTEVDFIEAAEQHYLHHIDTFFRFEDFEYDMEIE